MTRVPSLPAPDAHSLLDMTSSPTSSPSPADVAAAASAAGAVGSGASSPSGYPSPLPANPGPHNLPHLPYSFAQPSLALVSSPTALQPPPPLPSTRSPPLPSFATAPYHLAYLHSWPLMGSAHPSSPPVPIPPLDFQGERALLFDALTQSGRSFRVFTSHATTQQLLRLLTVGCRVLHYSGHGMSTCLAFESDAGDMQKVDAETLHQMMTAGRSADGGVQLAFVSACHSESTADAFLRAGVRHVIAVRSEEKIHDQAAQKFLSMFYYCICNGRSVREAFAYAKVSVLASPIHHGLIEDNKFLLLPADGDHDVTIFGVEVAPPGPWVDCSAEETPNNLQGLPEWFLSRNAEMQEIVAKVVKRRKKLLTLTGPVGVGKTALALAAATYICKRHLFDGVYFIDLGLLLTRPSATLATLCSEAMQLPTTFNHAPQLMSYLKQDRRHCTFLFIFDQAELAFAYDEPTSPRCLSTFLSSLFSSTQSRALLTSLDPLGAVRSDSVSQDFRSVQEGLLRVSPLSPGDSLKLFFNLKPRDIDFSEFGSPSGDSRMAAKVLIRHPVLLAIEGIPRRIWRVEEMLGVQGMRMHEPRLMHAIRAMIEEEREEERMRRARYRPQGGEVGSAVDDRAVIQASQRPDPNVQGNDAVPASLLSPASLPLPHVVAGARPSPVAAALWRQCAGNASCVSYSQLERLLQQHFIGTAGTPSRPLSMDDLAVVRHKMEHLSTGTAGGGRGLVTVEVFARFWEWFHPLVLTVARCRWVWTMQPVVLRAAGDARQLPARVPALHGFLQREQSTALLLSMAERSPKPFLLRLSESQSGCLTVCWLQGTQVQYTLIRVDAPRTALAAAAGRPPLRAAFTIELDGGGQRTFHTLSELMMEYSPFSTMYPNIPKAQVFGRPHEAEEEEEQGDEQQQAADYPPHHHHPHAHAVQQHSLYDEGRDDDDEKESKR